MGEAVAPIRFVRREVFAANPTPIKVHRLVVEREFNPHDHDVMLLLLAARGEGIHTTIYGGEAIRPGDAFIIRPGMWHSFTECRDLEAYVCCFGPELLQKELAWLLEDPALNYLFRVGPRSLDRKGVISIHLPAEACTEARTWFDRMMGCEALEPVRARTFLVGYLLLFLGELARWGGPGVALPGDKRPERVHRVVIEGLRLIRDDLAHDWTLNELAESLHVEKSYVVRLFKAHTGLSPMAYLAHCRAEKAATLLLTSDETVTEVAEKVGWTDPNYFARRFKSHFGMSATTYRARFGRDSS